MKQYRWANLKKKKRNLIRNYHKPPLRTFFFAINSSDLCFALSYLTSAKMIVIPQFYYTHDYIFIIITSSPCFFFFFFFENKVKRLKNLTLCMRIQDVPLKKYKNKIKNVFMDLSQKGKYKLIVVMLVWPAGLKHLFWPYQKNSHSLMYELYIILLWHVLFFFFFCDGFMIISL